MPSSAPSLRAGGDRSGATWSSSLGAPPPGTRVTGLGGGGTGTLAADPGGGRRRNNPGEPLMLGVASMGLKAGLQPTTSLAQVSPSSRTGLGLRSRIPGARLPHPLGNGSTPEMGFPLPYLAPSPIPWGHTLSL